MNGPVSLDMNVAIGYMQRMELDDDEFFGLIDDLGVMESVALECIREQQEEARKERKH